MINVAIDRVPLWELQQKNKTKQKKTQTQEWGWKMLIAY